MLAKVNWKNSDFKNCMNAAIITAKHLKSKEGLEATTIARKYWTDLDFAK